MVAQSGRSLANKACVGIRVVFIMFFMMVLYMLCVLPANMAYAGDGGYTVTIPKEISYTEMAVGSVSTSDTFDVTCTGHGTVEVSGTAGVMTGGNGTMTASVASERTPMTFNGAGTQSDTISLSGTTESANTWKGVVTYTCAQLSTPASLMFDANLGDDTAHAVSGMPANISDGEGYNVGDDYTWTGAPTRTGYVFVGWAETAGATQASVNVSYNSSTSAYTYELADAENTLYAVWQRATYTVHYNANGGAGVMSDSTFTYGVDANLSAYAFIAPTGLSFGGWADSVEHATAGTIYRGDGAAHGDMAESGTVNLYAIWYRDIEFKSGNNNTTTVTVKQYHDGATGVLATITAPGESEAVDMSNNGYSKLGWRSDTAAADKQVDFGASITPLVTTYYAVYSNTVRFVFWSGVDDVLTKTGYRNGGSYSVITPTLAECPTIDGWTNIGWTNTYGSSDVCVGFGEVWTGPDFRFYAVCTRPLYLCYDANGGTGTMSPTVVTEYRCASGGYSQMLRHEYDPYITFAENEFTRVGYEFSYWRFMVASTGTVYRPGEGNYAMYLSYDVLPNNGNARNTVNTAYANWSPISYSIRFNANGGSGVMADQTEFYYDTAKALNANAFTAPSGYTFGGWATSVENAANGTVAYANQANMTTGATTAGAIVDLYAVWYRDVPFYSSNGSSTSSVTVRQYWDGSTGMGGSVTTPSSVQMSPSQWTAVGWKSSTAAGTADAGFGESLTPTGSACYAVYSTTATFYSGYNKAAADTATAYYSASGDSRVMRGTISGIMPEYWSSQGWRNDTVATTPTYTNSPLTIGFGTNRVFYEVYSETGTMSYDGNGNTGGSTASTFSSTRYLNSGNTSMSSNTLTWTLASNGFTKTGSEFFGWDLGNPGTMYTATVAYDESPDRTATAIWGAPGTYVVRYNANGGTGSMEMSTFTVGGSGNLTPCSFTAPDGYRLRGWATSVEEATAGTVYRADGADHGDMATSGIVDLYAIWMRPINFISGSISSSGEDNTRTVTFQQYWDGATGSGGSVTAPPGSLALDIENWDKIGWHSDLLTPTQTPSAPFGQSFVPTATTYYVTYTQVFPTTFYAGAPPSDSVSLSGLDTVRLYYPPLRDGKCITISHPDVENTFFSKSGYVFKCWGNSPTNPTATMPGERTLTVTQNGGSGGYLADSTDMSQIWYAQWEPVNPTSGYAYAVLDGNGKLTFFRSTNKYNAGAGQTVVDIWGNQYNGRVYTDVESGPRWSSQRSNIKSVEVADNTIITPEILNSYFQGCNQLTSFDFKGWDTSNVTDMSYVFANCASLTTVDVSNIDVTSLRNTRSMFSGCTSLKTIYATSTTNWASLSQLSASSSSQMFAGCRSLKGGKGTAFNSSYVDKSYACTDKSGQAGYFTDIAQAGGGLSTEGMAYALIDNNNNLVLFRSNNSYSRGSRTVTDISGNQYTGYVFPGIEEDGFSCQWAGSGIRSVTIPAGQAIAPRSCYTWFAGCDSSFTTFSLRNLDTSNVTDMRNMFSDSSFTTIDLYNFDMSNVTTAKNMFSNCNNLTTIYTAADADWSRLPINGGSMFRDCYNLVGGNGTSMQQYGSTDTGLARVDGLNGNPGYFTVGSAGSYSHEGTAYAVFNKSTGELTLFRSTESYDNGRQYSSVTDIAGNTYSGYVYTGLESNDIAGPNNAPWSERFGQIVTVDIASGQGIAPVSTFCWFYGCSSMTSCDLKGLDTSNVIQMEAMFYNCSRLTEIDVSEFDMSSVQNVYNMFRGCSQLRTIYAASNADWSSMSNITNSSNMFYNCHSLAGSEGTLYTSSYVDKVYARIDKRQSNGPKGYFTAAEASSGTNSVSNLSTQSLSSNLLSMAPSLKPLNTKSFDEVTSEFDALLANGMKDDTASSVINTQPTVNSESSASSIPDVATDSASDVTSGAVETSAADTTTATETVSSVETPAETIASELSDASSNEQQNTEAAPVDSISTELAKRIEDTSKPEMQPVQVDTDSFIVWHMVRGDDGLWKLLWSKVDTNAILKLSSNDKLVFASKWDGTGRVHYVAPAPEPVEAGHETVSVEIDESYVLVSGELVWSEGTPVSLADVDAWLTAEFPDTVCLQTGIACVDGRPAVSTSNVDASVATTSSDVSNVMSNYNYAG